MATFRQPLLSHEEELALAKKQAAEARDGIGQFAPLPPIRQVSELPATGTDAVIDGLWRKEEVLLLGGHAKSWKSWALMDLSYCIANNLSWLAWDKVTPGRVLHIDLEIFDDEIRKRFELIHNSYESGSLDDIDVLSLRGHNFTLADFSKLDEVVEAKLYSVISFDPTYRMLAGNGLNESDPGVIIDLMNRALTLGKKLGSAISLLQHFSKGNQSEKRDLDAFSGSGVWGRAPDTCLTFREHDDEKCYTVSVNPRHWVRQEPFVVEFSYPRFRIAQTKDPENLKRPKIGRPNTFSVEDLCELIGSDEYISYADLMRRVKACKTSKPTFDRRLKEAKLAGHLALNPTDATYFLTSPYIEKHRNAKQR